MIMQIRTTKFPYFFWSYNKAYACRLNEENYLYENLEQGTTYPFKRIRSCVFLGLKYLLPFILVALTFRLYDFTPTKEVFFSYAFALLLFASVNFLLAITRTLTSIAIIACALFFGLQLEFIYLPLYALKYFVLLSLLLLLYLDSQKETFCLMKDSKVVAHFSLEKGLLYAKV